MEEIERRAESILAELPPYIWDGDARRSRSRRSPTRHFGLHVRDVAPAEMREAPVCAADRRATRRLAASCSPSLGQIWVNADEAVQWPPRRRFTIAHELGHHVLHRTGQQALFCRKAVVDPEDKPATTKPPIPVTEQEANAFAAALLMPARLVERYYRETEGDFEQLCLVFKSSGAAMGRRLHAVI